MIITAIKPAKKHCFEVQFENESILLDKDIVAKNALKIGQSLSDEQIYDLQYASSLARAVSKAMWLVSRRDYSKKEMIMRLKKDKFDEDAVYEAVERLCESSVIDDERFAYNYAYNLKENRKLGKRAIIMELLQKGVDRDIAESIAEQFCDDEVSDAAEFIKLKYPGFLEDEKINRRMTAALFRKGYSYDTVKKAIEQIEDE